MSPLVISFDNRADFFSAAGCRFLLAVTVREKNGTERLVSLNEAVVAITDGSISTISGSLRFTVTIISHPNAFLRLSKACLTCCGKGKVLFPTGGLVLPENGGIHFENIPVARRRDFMFFGGGVLRSGFIRSISGVTSPWDMR